MTATHCQFLKLRLPLGESQDGREMGVERKRAIKGETSENSGEEKLNKHEIIQPNQTQ